jgi:hypothetical protein
VAPEASLSAYRFVAHGNSTEKTGKEIKMLKGCINESDDRNV